MTDTAPITSRVARLDVSQIREAVDESRRCGHRFVQRLVDEWASGINRFDRPGEALFTATLDGRIVGMCGLNVDPHAADDRTGRVRHLYVLAAHRGKGVGRLLVQRVISEARGRFDRLRLRATDEGAARFYEALGFQCTAETGCTHALDLGNWAVPVVSNSDAAQRREGG